VIINSGVEVAQKQVEQINKAKKMINELYKDNKVTDKVTRENYESTK
jgi:UDP-N-acetyl-D-mannosaminuronate dehydrogenase